MTFATDGGIEWEKDETNRTLTIRPTDNPEGGLEKGQMVDYDWEGGAPWYEGSSLKEGEWTLIIESGVTHIGVLVFMNCKFTGTLTIPDTVTSIGDSAFEGCYGFTGTLTIPSGVTSIAGYAFSGCSGFANVEFLGNQPTIYSSDAFALTISSPEKTYDVYTNGWANSTTFPEYEYTKWNYKMLPTKYVTKSGLIYYTTKIKNNMVARVVTEDDGAKSIIDNQKGQNGSVMQSEFGDTIVSFNTNSHDGENGILGQIYAKTKSTGVGMRFNIYKDGIYYNTNGTSSEAKKDEEHEIAVKGDFANKLDKYTPTAGGTSDYVYMVDRNGVQGHKAIASQIDSAGLVTGDMVKNYVDTQDTLFIFKTSIVNDTTTGGSTNVASAETVKTLATNKVDKKEGYTLSKITLNGTITDTPTFHAPTTLENGKYLTNDGSKLVWKDLGTIYSYKGSVNTEGELPTVAEKGDVYNVIQAGSHPAGTNFAWDGSAWDALGGTVDLSSYATKTELTSGLATKQNALTDAQMSACNSGITAVKVEAYDEHKNDGTIHVTSTDKEKWNGYETTKQDKITATVGSATQAMYLNAGTFTAISQSVGSTSKGMYLNAGVFTEMSETVGSGKKPVYLNAGTITVSGETVGSATKPIFLNAGEITVSNGVVGTSKQPIYMDNGELKATTETVGSTSQMVYLNSGVITAGMRVSSGTADPSGGNNGDVYIKYTA